MSYSIAKLKTDIISTLHGTTLDSLQNVYQLIFRGASEILLDVDPQETIRTVQIPNAVYGNVYDYTSASDLKGNKIIQIFPQVNRSLSDHFAQTYSESFDLDTIFGIQPEFSIKFDTYAKSVKINNPLLPEGILVNQCDSITGNGTWAVSPLATNLRLDTLNYVSSSASLVFDLGAGPNPSIGYIENSTMTPVDLSTHLNAGAEFIWVYFSLPLTVTNVNLRWGSSAADYYDVTVTSQQDGTVFQTGWNLLRFDWLGATVTGAPNASAIDYNRVTITYDGTAQPNVRIDQSISRLGSIYNMEYYSKFLFRDAVTGAFKEEVTSDDDLVNLDTETYMLLTDKCAELAAQQNGGTDAAYDVDYFTKKYFKTLLRYKGMYKSQIAKPRQFYYKGAGNRRNGSNFMGGWRNNN